MMSKLFSFYRTFCTAFGPTDVNLLCTLYESPLLTETNSWPTFALLGQRKGAQSPQCNQVWNWGVSTDRYARKIFGLC